VDDIIVFHSLTRADLVHIVEIQLRRLQALLAEHGLALTLSDRAKGYLADIGFDPTYGARPLKRAIQTEVQNPLAMALLEGRFKAGQTIAADYRDGAIVFANA